MKKWKISKVISWILIIALSHTVVSASEVQATSIAVETGIRVAITIAKHFINQQTNNGDKPTKSGSGKSKEENNQKSN